MIIPSKGGPRPLVALLLNYQQSLQVNVTTLRFIIRCLFMTIAKFIVSYSSLQNTVVLIELDIYKYKYHHCLGNGRCLQIEIATVSTQYITSHPLAFWSSKETYNVGNFFDGTKAMIGCSLCGLLKTIQEILAL